MLTDQRCISVICSGCGKTFDCPEPEASGEAPVFCTDECEDDCNVRGQEPRSDEYADEPDDRDDSPFEGGNYERAAKFGYDFDRDF